MKRIALTILVLGSLVVACDRVVELAPAPDGSAFDGNLDGQSSLRDAGDGGVIDVPDGADGDAGLGDGGTPSD